MMQNIQNALSNMASSTKYRSKFLRDYQCPNCRSWVKVYRLTDVHGNVSEQSIGCNCGILKLIDEEQQAVNQQRIDRIFNQYSLVNKSLLSASFETFRAYRADLKKAFEQVKRYADSFRTEKSSNLFFQSSGFGTGKSHLSMAVVRAVKQKGYTAIFISTPKLLTKIRSTYKRDAETTEDELINNLISADLVVFDDLGAENAGGWGREKLFELIDQRSGKSSIFTTNLDSADFKADKDMGRLFSRMMENSRVISLSQVPDYRMRNLAKRVSE